MKRLCMTLLLTAGSAVASAQPSPVGLWKTIDDGTQKETSYVRISEASGVLSGKIEKLFDTSKLDEVCNLCTDDRQGQRKLGLTIIRSVRQNASDADTWDSGDILDPENGKVYRVRLKLIENGRRLEVRGYIGMPLLGRTQTWIRSE